MNRVGDSLLDCRKEEQILNRDNIIEFDEIKRLWAGYALTEAAKKQIDDEMPSLNENELCVKLRETSQAYDMVEKCGNPPLVSLRGISDYIEAARKGDCLAAVQLLEVESALVAVKRMKGYLTRGRQFEMGLAYYDEQLEPLEELQDAINSCIVGEQVADYASSRLKELRSDIAIAQSKMREKAERAIRANKDCMSDQFSTFRNGHICIPVKKEYKFRIEGNVIDHSATGSTVFVEPEASARYYEELQGLSLEEDNEVRRILYELTAMVADQHEIFKDDIRMMERLDYIFSKGKFSLSYQGIEPTITQERRMELIDARHPLMPQEECVPLQFAIGGKTRGVVITGPNTGGKTVAIKTVALNAMMAQCGLHVACREAIVCQEANDKGVLQVQLPGHKIWINHKRVKLHVAASELYPEDYDFSIIFEGVSERKMRHQMERKLVEGEVRIDANL